MSGRPLLLVAVAATCFAEAACTSNKTDQTSQGTVGQTSQTTDGSNASKREVPFDPQIVVDWPGKPRADVSMAGFSKTYYAQYHEPTEAGGRLFALSITELSDEVKDVPFPKERLEASTAALTEGKRTPLEFGPRKLPALEIEGESGEGGEKVYKRNLFIVDGRRVYTLSVMGRNMESLRKDRAKAFFDSAKLPEY
jgi:hypothetical protein